MNEYLEVSIRFLAAVAIGGMVGMERSYHGRPAGFRTHTLVCLASAVLMLVTTHEGHWFTARAMERVTIDPTRMAQGIMTGIGFLGAGVIMKEGLSVRGLTTAASIWITAAIGILIGIGLYIPAALAATLTLSTLSLFRWIEGKIASHQYGQLVVRFARESAMSEFRLRELVHDLEFTIANLHYRLVNDGKHFEYRMMIRSQNSDNFRQLSEVLMGLTQVLEFRIAPTGD